MALKIKRRSRLLGRLVIAAGLFAGACSNQDASYEGAKASSQAKAPSGGEYHTDEMAPNEAPNVNEPAPVLVAEVKTEREERTRLKTKKQLAIAGGASMGAPAAPPVPTRVQPPAKDTTSNTESYTDYGVNPWTKTDEDRLSTFSIDVDTASYAITRRKILAGTLPPSASVRVEEFVNYFKYSYNKPNTNLPFSVDFEGAPAPGDSKRHIVRIGVQGKALEQVQRKPVHLTFLVDVSGSMSSADKLPLAKTALKLLVNQLQEGDTVALVTYAGATKLVLEPTGMHERARIIAALDDLRSGGGTAMASGMQLAYEQASKTLQPGHESRVIVLSDGDANIGATSQTEILSAISGHVEEGVTMSTIGFGMGNYKDTAMEQLANKGNGNYYYIDSQSQAKRVFVEQLGSTLQVIAKDVKIQVEFDPAVVEEYRLVGYENRDIADKDFRNDKVDAGEIGAGHQVTALYELKLKKDGQGDLGTVRIRHKAPEGTAAAENAFTLGQDALASSFDAASSDFRFAMAAVSFAEILRNSPESGQRGYEQVLEMARAAADQKKDRLDFIELVEAAASLPRG